MMKGVTFEALSELLFAGSATLVLLMTMIFFTGSIFSMFVILRTVLFVAERFELIFFKVLLCGIIVFLGAGYHERYSHQNDQQTY